jgi:hypothetical protein
MSLIPQRITPSTPEVAPPGWAEDHNKRRPETPVPLTSFPLLPPKEPGIVKQGIKGLLPILRWQIIQYLSKETDRGMRGVL